jgi:hypothetical protein
LHEVDPEAAVRDAEAGEPGQRCLLRRPIEPVRRAGDELAEVGEVSDCFAAGIGRLVSLGAAIGAHELLVPSVLTSAQPTTDQTALPSWLVEMLGELVQIADDEVGLR